MKIDIHTHTRKIKSGDADTRNIETTRFVETLRNTDVKILAITNHNHFDLKQFEEFRDGLVGVCQIWPGIEFDILENGRRAHLLVICNPKNYIRFKEKVDEILLGKHPDNFTISISETVSMFDPLDCIFVAHYLAKKPNLGDEEIEILIKSVSNPRRILKEATNSISAGIYISHGHNSIYGSDIQNWDDYIPISQTLPELRLPVETFEQFSLLLEKDEATINTLLSKKVKEDIELNPFNNAAEIVRLNIFNDINILFGSKGTGKTEILEALSKYYNGKGYRTNVYKSNDQHLRDKYDLKGNSLNINAKELGLDECEDEIASIRIATEVEVTSIAKYQQHYSVQETNKISQKLKIRSITKSDEKQPKRKLKEIHELLTRVKEFATYSGSNIVIKEYIDELLLNELASVLGRITVKLQAQTELKFFESKSVKFVNHVIGFFNKEISKKTGQPEKPIKTGFSEYASNRIKIEQAVNKVLNNLNKNIQSTEEYVGSLGDKGDLFCKTSIATQNGNFIDSKYNTVNPVNKSPQKKFAKQIISISKFIFTNELFQKIAELNQLEDIESIDSITSLLLFHKHFTLGGKPYEPSNGESSMILLFKELMEEKDIYLIDEPEKSLGNDYINDVIVPLLKEKALLGKKVIIATHDANIAVRTLPYNSIYRLYENNLHYTMTGNPFSNLLKCIYNSRPELDWKEISMKTLEGGKQAFGERGKIYGN